MGKCSADAPAFRAPSCTIKVGYHWWISTGVTVPKLKMDSQVALKKLLNSLCGKPNKGEWSKKLCRSHKK